MQNLPADFTEYVQQKMGDDFVGILSARGINTRQAAEKFLFPTLADLTDPYQFSGVREIVDRIRYAVSAGEKIVVFGDYDCDGISAVYILCDYLRTIHADVSYFIPNREEDGYGLTYQAIETIAETYFPDLIITVDCGISGHDEIEYAKDLGMDVIVTDHHELPDVLPECPIFNTKLDAETQFSMHCGAGTAFLLVVALGGIEAAERYLDVAAVATVGDIVPLTDDNRIIVHAGLKKINSRDCNEGIKQFFEKVGVTKVTSGDIAFKLVPGINAFGRLGDAGRALELYTTSDRFVLMGVIDKMLSVNAERKQLCLDLEEHVVEKLTDADFSQTFGICLYDMRWMAGVLGIAAAYVAERYMRPTILFTEKGGLLKGSGRSTEKVDLLDAIRACADLTESYGGHRQAAGVTLKKENFDEFSRRFNQYVAKKYSATDFVHSRNAELTYSTGKADYEYVKRLDMLEPCGYGNPRPKFKVSSRAGKCIPFKNNPINFRYSFGEQFAIPVFNQQGKASLFATNAVEKSMILEFKLNHYNGNVYVDAMMNACEFLPSAVDDWFATRSLSYSIAKNTVIGVSNSRDLDEILAGTTGFGTLFIAYDEASVQALQQRLGNPLPVRCGDLTDANPSDKILLLPICDIDVSAYNRVVFLDLPVLSAIGKAEYFALDFNRAKINLPKESVSRDGLIFAFKSIAQKIKSGCITEDLVGVKQSPFDVFAYYVFNELGIIREDGARSFLTDVKSDLTRSRLYNYVSNN